MADRKDGLLTFRCTEGERLRLERMSEERGVTISALVAEALAQGVPATAGPLNWSAVRSWQGVYAARGAVLNDVAHDLNSVALMISSGLVGSTARAVGMDVTTGLFEVSRHDVVLCSMRLALMRALAPARVLAPHDAPADARRPRGRRVCVRVPASTAETVRGKAEELGMTLTEAILGLCVYADRMPVQVDRPLLESICDERARQKSNSGQIDRALERIGEIVAETGAASPLDDNVPTLAENARESTREWSSVVDEAVGPALRASRLVRDL